MIYISNLNKSFADLVKAQEDQTIPGAKTTPGAVSGGSKQVIDCPLGAACPDGGKHQFGSTKLQEHTTQAMQMAQTGQHPNDESSGKPVDKPGVAPGSTNIGSIGSDKANRPSPKTRGALNPNPGQVRSKMQFKEGASLARQGAEEDLATAKTQPGVDFSKQEKQFEDTHKKQSSKATKMLGQAKKDHEKVTAQANKIKQSNEKKT